ncbi:helix-turn-helix transcriptional regulator [Clostridium sp.]|uniref:helix-turn-helix transcriptional regulator n=1 Tax=Clostridium sp. TaxID=1506 RepID=UPI00283DE992|nr:helix-turn-helix transcriptional regulator [Clostridium sp.]MDR3596796.1 helix-turn-helix transcriptional regulator [Clostridium sp.]
MRYITGLSQINFGKKLHKCENTIVKWESGVFVPTKESQQLIIEAFNLPKNYFD